MFNRSTMMQVLDVALPVIGEMTLYTLMFIFDTIMIGNYGGNAAVSVVGISSEIIYTCVDIFIAVGIAIGITSLVAQSIGSKDIKAAEQYAAAGVMIGTIISLSIAFIIFKFSKQILYFGSVRGSILYSADVFTKITAVAAFFYMQTTINNAVLRGYGNTFTPLVICSVVAITKIVFDWILIFGHVVPRLGINGSAYASIIAYILGFVLSGYYLLFKAKVKVKLRYVIFFRKNIIKKLLKISIPSSMEDGAFNVSRLLCTFIVMRTGTIAFASNQIANTIETISVMPGIGFGLAATTLVGIKIGEKNYKKAKEYAYSCAFWSVFFMSMFSIIFLTMSKWLAVLFVNDTEKEVMRLTALCLFVGAFEQPSIAISAAFSGALKGAGDTKSPLLVSVLSSWLIRLPLMFYFIYILKLSIVYVWWITALQWTFDAVMMYTCFKNKFKGYSYVSK